MSIERRAQLAERIAEDQPALGAFVRKAPADMTAGSWDFLSYSFQRGFEAMWDQSAVDRSGLLLRPLLLLWRQSVELAIKATIMEMVGEIRIKASHDIQKLFEHLVAIISASSPYAEDDYTDKVRQMIILVQSFDPFADRFRYPTNGGGVAFDGVEADLDELYMAHWIITTWCEGAVLEVYRGGKIARSLLI